MRKSKLFIEYDYNFDLCGIISQAKDYKLAWSINQILNIHLVKGSDIQLEYLDQDNVFVSNFIYETENSILRILKNRSDQENDTKPLLLPELSNFDYFIMSHDSGDAFDMNDIIKTLKELDIVQYVQSINVSKLKSKENLIFYNEKKSEL